MQLMSQAGGIIAFEKMCAYPLYRSSKLLPHVYKIVWRFLKNELGGGKKKKTVERLFKNCQINLSDIYLILEDIEDLEDIRRYRKGMLNLWM